MSNIDLERYKKDGFLVIKNFFPPSVIQNVLNEAKGVFFKQFLYKKYVANSSADAISEAEFNTCLYRLFDEDITTLMNCGKQVQHLFSLHRLSLDEKIESLIRRVGLQTPNISTRPVLYFNHKHLAKSKVFYKVDSHQDWRSMQGSLNAVVIWIPLVDINKALGALEIIPGSHLSGLRTDHMDSGFGMVSLSEVDNKKVQSVELQQGDILIFSSFLIHQSGENITDRPRWSCHFRYNDLSEKTFIARGYAHPYIYKSQEELITPGFPTQKDVARIFN